MLHRAPYHFIIFFASHRSPTFESRGHTVIYPRKLTCPQKTCTGDTLPETNSKNSKSHQKNIGHHDKFQEKNHLPTIPTIQPFQEWVVFRSFFSPGEKSVILGRCLGELLGCPSKLRWSVKGFWNGVDMEIKKRCIYIYMVYIYMNTVHSLTPTLTISTPKKWCLRKIWLSDAVCCSFQGVHQPSWQRRIRNLPTDAYQGAKRR